MTNIAAGTQVDTERSARVGADLRYPARQSVERSVRRYVRGLGARDHWQLWRLVRVELDDADLLEDREVVLVDVLRDDAPIGVEAEDVAGVESDATASWCEAGQSEPVWALSNTPCTTTALPSAASITRSTSKS